jgi:hypothetical protein
MKQGLPPVTGGALDQSAWFVSMFNQLTSDEAMAQAEAIKRGD